MIKTYSKKYNNWAPPYIEHNRSIGDLEKFHDVHILYSQYCFYKHKDLKSMIGYFVRQHCRPT
jgi:hypothetical protein